MDSPDYSQSNPRQFDVERFMQGLAEDVSEGHQEVGEDGKPTGKLDPENKRREISNKLSSVALRAPQLGDKVPEAISILAKVYDNDREILREIIKNFPALAGYLDVVFPKQEEE